MDGAMIRPASFGQGLGLRVFWAQSQTFKGKAVPPASCLLALDTGLSQSEAEPH